MKDTKNCNKCIHFETPPHLNGDTVCGAPLPEWVFSVVDPTTLTSNHAKLCELYNEIRLEVDDLKCCGNCKYQDWDENLEIDMCFVCGHPTQIQDDRESKDTMDSCEDWEFYKETE